MGKIDIMESPLAILFLLGAMAVLFLFIRTMGKLITPSYLMSLGLKMIKGDILSSLWIFGGE